MFQKILLATDGSQYAIQAAQKAIEVVQSHPNATVHIVYVVDITKAKTAVLENWNTPLNLENRKEKLKETEALLKEAGISYESHILRGQPGPTLVKFANEGNFDLVVVGSRGKNKLQEFVLGSVSHKVAKRANCPVLIVKGIPHNNNVNASTIPMHVQSKQK